MRYAVVHDGAPGMGGAVRVVTEAANAVEGDLYVGWSGKPVEWWDRQVDGETFMLTQHRTSSKIRDVLLARKMLSLDLSDYDVVLTSGPVTKFYQPNDGQRHIHYMHHPPLDTLWFDGGLLNYALMTIDRVETQSIPTIVTNSDLTAERLQTKYNRVADGVINPPVDVARFDPTGDRTDDFVMVGRLENRKRPDVAIEAFRNVDATLHVLGEGPLLDELQQSAPPNVRFHGHASDEEVEQHLERAHAGVFLAKREDFGITPVEYMAAGLPVLAVDEPNTNRQIDDSTGVFVDPSVEGVVSGAESILEKGWDREELSSAATTYNPERFRREIREVVE